MGKIKQLAPEEIHKIAAGEVVERPANVIKELIENSIDANARTITIYIEQGGKKLLRVVDDGCGMSREDAYMCIKHHATSKLSTVAELESITTFGFRGEALSSIAAVGQMTLISKSVESSEGIKLTIKESKVIDEKLVSCNQGTDITIIDLFYTLPVRKKFLKSDETEWRAIYQLVQAFTLCYPECGFILYHNQKLVMQCKPVDSFLSRANEIYDRSMLDSMIPFESIESDIISIVGYCTNAQYMRYDRNSIYIFVNRRWVKNTKLSHSLIKGYNNVLIPGRYPAAVVFINIDPNEIDVNIHPRKEEVQFLHPRRVELAIEQIIRSSLEKHTSSKIQKIEETRSAIVAERIITARVAQEYEPRTKEISQIPSIQEQKKFTQILESSFALESTVPDTLAVESQSTISSTEMEKQEYRILGQLLKTYIVIESGEELLLIDQHAAHERVMYELFEQRFNEVSVVPLLFPEVININEDEADLLEKNVALFAKYGISLERLNVNQYSLQTIPVMLKNISLEEIVKNIMVICQTHKEPQTLENLLHHELRASMACKAAVKAGDVLTSEHMHELISSLNKVNNRFSCPHGRPTSWPITKYEIERKFKRKL